MFVYCYGRIFHTIRRQSKVFSGSVGRSQDVPMATTSRDPNIGQGQVQQQQQASGTAAGGKLSHTEMNVLKTMIVVIVCFLLFWSTPSIANLFELFGVSICIMYSHVIKCNNYLFSLQIVFSSNSILTAQSTEPFVALA